MVAFATSKTHTSHYIVGSVVRYGCSAGYTLDGNSLVVCQSDGTWSQAPVCLKACSSMLPVFANTAPTSRSPPYTSGHVILYRCTGKYVNDPTGTNFITCGDPPVIPFGYAVDAMAPYTVGDIVSYTCIVGTAFKGHNLVACQSDGTWSTSPICHRVCGEVLPTVANASPVSQPPPYFTGAIVTYTCNSDFDNTANNFIVCMDDATWFGDPQCLAKSCSPTPTFDNADPVPGKSFVGSVIQYTCATGYAIGPNCSNTVVCGEDGFWTGEVICIETCSQETLPDSGGSFPILGSGPPFYVGDRVVCGCPEGSSIDPCIKNFVQCQPGGTWSNPPKCRSEFVLKKEPLMGIHGVSAMVEGPASVRRTKDDLNFLTVENGDQCVLTNGHAVAMGRFQAASDDDFWLDDVNCGGSEQHLLDCTASTLGTEDCTAEQYAGIICTNDCMSTL
ncbi:sushi, von Willebrand factor type A, EGF and pentraxin domain-containing protein 1-like [Mya arenaria]|uniref:sushi, von Willebrand factor type A, EGF and pentraxin domain-containing protein 1-like n=1 Tax=Mya arenaria TaxID=6604 RepID=UPI0022E582D0|nr:sushi, von Willebrand factor type A, EGF and pentraxin domain-containing protein 1-like [Mya arenaria]